MMQFVVFEGINEGINEGISQRKQLAGLIVRFLLTVVPSYQVSFACVDFSIKNICLRIKSTVARFNTVDMQTIRVIITKKKILILIAQIDGRRMTQTTFLVHSLANWHLEHQEHINSHSGNLKRIYVISSLLRI